MKTIEDNRIQKIDEKFVAHCVCGSARIFTTKNAAIRMLNKGSCLDCKRDYRNVGSGDSNIYQNKDDKWCSTCSGCGIEQIYSRKDHAKQSSLCDFQCMKCAKAAKKFSKNASVGYKKRTYNKFLKSAARRDLEWNLTLDQMYESYDGFCNLTGWELSLEYGNITASLDRIDNSKGYVVDNIQWVHTMVNMSKNKYDQIEFIKMCKAVADKNKW